jgi:predicted transcriptional regulator
MIKSAMAKSRPISPPTEDDRAYVAAVEDGLKSLDAGRSLPYEKVRRWLLSWGTDKELPPPECP